MFYPHIVNNCVKRHINIPAFTQSEETVYSDQYVNGMPMYFNDPNVYNNSMNQNPYMKEETVQMQNMNFNNNPFNF